MNTTRSLAILSCTVVMLATTLGCEAPPRVEPRSGLNAAKREMLVMPDVFTQFDEPRAARDARWRAYTRLVDTRTALDLAVVAANAFGPRAGMTRDDARSLSDAFDAAYENLARRAEIVASPAWNPTSDPLPDEPIRLPPIPGVEPSRYPLLEFRP